MRLSPKRAYAYGVEAWVKWILATVGEVQNPTQFLPLSSYRSKALNDLEEGEKRTLIKTNHIEGSEQKKQ